MKWCYECYKEHKKPKGIIKKIIYKIWLACGVSPCHLTTNDMEKIGELLIQGYKEGFNDNKKVN